MEPSSAFLVFLVFRYKEQQLVYIKECLKRCDVVMLAGSVVGGALIVVPEESHCHHA